MSKVIGIDIGGTKTSIGLVDIKLGKILKKIIVPSKKFKNDKKNLDYIVNETLNFSENIKVTHELSQKLTDYLIKNKAQMPLIKETGLQIDWPNSLLKN